MSEILVVPRDQAGELPLEGVWGFDSEKMPQRWSWMDRAQAETDENHLQLIPYVAVMRQKCQVWAYRRTGGDHRLADRRSCGIGGHVDREDSRNGLTETLAVALSREVDEELAWNVSALSVPEPVAWIYEHHSAVGRVHLGLLYVLDWCLPDEPRPREGEQLEGVGFLELTTVIVDERFELWSRLAARFLSERHQASLS